MTANEMPKNLFEALARFQAQLPQIGKGNTAQVRSDKGNYSYKYADLADVSEAVLPRLGALGLAFTARPTLIDGHFVLAYSLVHVSGDREDGIYMLPGSGTPQQIGSAITYARRYCLCAAVGVAPAEDDDDAAAAQTVTRQSAGDAWENSTPAPPRPAQPRPAAQVSRPEQPQQQAEDGDEKEPDQDAQAYADEAYQALTLSTLEDVHRRAREAGKLTALIRNPSSGKTGKLALYLDWRRKQVKEAEDALTALQDEAAGRGIADLDAWYRTVMGAELDDATPSQLRNALKTLQEKAAA